MSNVYELRGVTMVYQQAALLVRALDGIDLAVAPGEFLVVEGPSGSGKSTLLQLLGGLDRASEGELVFEGNDLGQMGDVDLSDLRLRAFGFVFQQFNLIPTLTARENVEVALAPMGLRPHQRRRRAADLLAQVGLADRGPHLPSQLSGGEQQRVAIARALANEPRVVLADEPTGNLDSRTGDVLVALLASLAVEHGHTVVLITHDRAIADRAPRVIHLRDGRLAQAGDEVAGPALPAGPPASPFQVMARRAASTMLRQSGLEEPADSGHGLTAAWPRTGEAQAPNGDDEPLFEIDLRDRQGADVRAPTPWWVAPTTEADPRPVILRVEQVRKNYVAGETEVEALRGINLEVRQGEYVAVVGPSGCGKTTLLNCLSGLDAIDGGRVLLEGQTLHELPDAERARARATNMGFVFQAYNLVPVFTAAENVELPLLVAGASPGEARQRAVETLTRVGLGHRVNHRPLQLSGGEQQRVTIARALVGEPRIIWADEPTGNLDSETAASVIELLWQLHLEGLTLVLVTHDAGIAAQAGRRVKMADGRVVSDESTGIAPRPPTGIAAAEAQAGGEVVPDDATDIAPARLIDITAAEAQAGLSLPDSTGGGAGSASS